MKIVYLAYLGLLLVFISVAYEMIFIGIPYQDSTDEMIIARNNQYLLKDIIWWTGVLLATGGFITFFVMTLSARLKR